jgi:hypothetical protein
VAIRRGGAACVEIRHLLTRDAARGSGVCSEEGLKELFAMKRIVLLLAALAAVAVVSACNGSHHSPTDPGNPPIIGNLKVLSFVRDDARTGQIPLSFDYSDPDGDVARVLVTFSNGVANNPLPDASGHKTGTASFLQAVALPDPGAKQLAFFVQVSDARGNLSNTLSGTVATP